MFKLAYVRGITNALVNGGAAVFPDETTANKVADYIADRTDLDLSKPVPRETTHKIASEILTASNAIQKLDGFKAASFNKVASWDDVHALADRAAVQLMEKAAEGSTIEGGDKGNEQKQSPAGETKMDASQRPPGYATDSRGKSDVDTRPGAVGKEEENPNAPARSDDKGNSLQEQSRTASVTLARLFKAAEGSTIMGGDKGNKEMSSAEAKMDASQRPPGYAVLPSQGALGEMMKHITGPAVIGKETAQPNKPAETPSGSNSVTQTSAKAAEEDPYITLFKKTAAEINEYLPVSFDDGAKVAAVRACMGLNTQEKAYYLHDLQKQASAKTAAPAAVPPGSRTDGYAQHSPEATHSRPGAYDGRRGNQGTKAAEDGALPPFMKKDDEKKDDEKKDEKKDEDGEKKDMPPWMKEEKEKEAALRQYIQGINQAQRTAS